MLINFIRGSLLPEPLKQKPGGLQPHQLRVYEDFTKGHKPVESTLTVQQRIERLVERLDKVCLYLF